MSVPRGSSWCSDEDLRVLLGEQHGLITTEQARNLGMSTSMFSKRAKRGEFERVLPRVWRATLVPPSLQQDVLAAVLWAGAGAVASHVSAGRIWGLKDLAEGLHVWVPATRWRSDRVTVHRGDISARERRLRDGIPVTSPARTLVDLASVLDEEQLEVAVESFLHRGLTTPFSISKSLDRRKGSARLRTLLEQRDRRALESPLEVKVWRLLTRARLRPVRQHEVHCGEHRYRLDFAWPALKVAVEADGFDAHGGRRAFVADRRRSADLGAAGWVVIPVTWDDCAKPDAIVERVRAALLRAA